MNEDPLAGLEEMDAEELLGRLEGGLFSLFTSEEQYGEMARIAAALGIKDFVTSTMKDLGKEELIELFGDGEKAISAFLQYAADKGLLETTGGVAV